MAVGVASHYIPEIRPYTDPFADVVSFIPLYGDAFALGYYGAQGGLDCAAGSCDPVAVGLSLGGSVPIVGDLGKAVKLGGVGIGFFGLVTKTAGRADDIARFTRTFGHLEGAGDVIRLARRGSPSEIRHSLAVMDAAKQLDPKRILRFGDAGKGEPDILLRFRAGAADPASRWVEIKKSMQGVSERRLNRWLEDVGPGEVWFYGTDPIPISDLAGVTFWRL